jgi:hypothetical protein
MPIELLATTAMLDAPDADPASGGVDGALCASISMSANRAPVRPVSVSGTPCAEGASVGMLDAAPEYVQVEFAHWKPPNTRTLSRVASTVIVSSYLPLHTITIFGAPPSASRVASVSPVSIEPTGDAFVPVPFKAPAETNMAYVSSTRHGVSFGSAVGMHPAGPVSPPPLLDPVSGFAMPPSSPLAGPSGAVDTSGAPLSKVPVSGRQVPLSAQPPKLVSPQP